MKVIQDGDKLPTLPFKVVCEDNYGREEDLVKDEIYTVVRLCRNGLDIAGPDLILHGIDNRTFSIRRFSIMIVEGSQASLRALDKSDISDWRTWRNNGLEPGQCVCRIPKELCWIHQ